MGLLDTLVGVMPDPTSASFAPWAQDAVQAALGLCPVARETTYYFSQTGNDSTGDGSIGTPWKTIAKAQAIHDAWTHDPDGIAFLFKRGEVWEESTGLAITEDDVTIGAYGDGAPPLFSWFTEKILETADAWTNITGDRWTATTTAPGWLRETARPLIGYAKVASTAEVEAIPYSFYDTGGTTHINAGTSVDPNDIDFEFTDSTDTGEMSGILVSSSGCRVDGLALHGWGMEGGINDQDYGVKFDGTGTDLFCCTNCECFYNDRHNMGQNGGSVASGGASVWVNNEFGYVAEQSGTPFIAYTGYGGQSCLAVGNRCRFGALPDDNRTYASGRAFFSHSDGSAGHEIDLFACVNNTVDADSMWPCDNAFAAAAAGSPTAATVADCRIVQYGTKQLGFGVGTGIGTAFFANQATVASHFELRPRHVGQLALGLYDAGGWVVNTLIDFDMADVTGIRWGLFNTSTASSPKFWHSHIHVRRNATTQFVCDVDNFTGSGAAQAALAGSEFVNSILTATEAGTDNATTVTVGLLNDAAAYRNIALGSGTDEPAGDEAHDQAVNVVRFGRFTRGDRLALAGDPLVGAGEAGLVEVDAMGRLRSTTAPTIGPYEGDDLSGRGRKFEHVTDMQRILKTLGPVQFISADGTATRV